MKPPADITPQQFFETWLPEQLAGAPPVKPATVRVRLDGEGGGVWDLVLGPSGLTVVPGGGTGEAEVTLAQTVADWRAITVGEPGAVTLAPPQAKPTDILFLDRAAQQVVAMVKGTIRFEVTGYNGRTWALIAKLGPGRRRGGRRDHVGRRRDLRRDPGARHPARGRLLPGQGEDRGRCEPGDAAGHGPHAALLLGRFRRKPQRRRGGAEDTEI
jgi:hypothetical protein